MQIDFFATNTDLAQVWRWLFDFPNMKLLENCSEPDQENIWYDNWEDFRSRFESHKGCLAAWPQSVGGLPRKEIIVFDQATQSKLGAKGRTVLESPALIQIYGLGEVKDCLGNSSLNSFNEKSVRRNQYFPEEFSNEIDWSQLRSIVRKIQRQLKKTCPAKLRNTLIMPDAFAKFQNGEIKLWNWGQECLHPSEFITLTNIEHPK